MLPAVLRVDPKKAARVGAAWEYPKSMQAGPATLPEGSTLQGRFEIQAELGRGGFGIAYLSKDLTRRDDCVLKELAPLGSARDASGVLQLDALGTAHASRLRQAFVRESQVLGKLRIPGVPHVRASFYENGTAYFATDYVRGARTLEDALADGPVSYDGGLDILLQCLDILSALHGQGLLHRDIKPSNLLIGPGGKVELIDFGASREWHADSTARHTVLFTPGYAPPEQMSSRSRRGPASDLFALSATVYHALTGIPPPSPSERAAGEPLLGVRALRADVPIAFENAIEAGLRLPFAERPQSAEAMRSLLESEAAAEDAEDALESFDSRAIALRNLRFSRRQCPACEGLLEASRPLRRLACPVCREGTIRARKIVPGICPACRLSPLKRRSNSNPPAICPICKTGLLARDRKGPFSKEFVLRCGDCEACFVPAADGMTLAERGNVANEADEHATRSFEEWLKLSGRSREFWLCGGCGAQLDAQSDGRYLLQVPANTLRYASLFPDEWARVAAGLPPGSGNSECDSCGADYFRDGERVTLVESRLDPYHFSQHYLGRLLDVELVRWVGVGKYSPSPGFVCQTCLSEFDAEGAYLRLVQSPNAKISRRTGQTLVLEDWHRAARDLPLIAEGSSFEAEFDAAVVRAYETGRVDLGGSGRSKVTWKGPARRFDLAESEWRATGSGELSIRDGEIAFGTLLHKWRAPLDAVVAVTVEESSVVLTVQGEPSPIAFEVESVELSAQLESGIRKVPLGEIELAARLRHEIGLPEAAP